MLDYSRLIHVFPVSLEEDFENRWCEILDAFSFHQINSVEAPSERHIPVLHAAPVENIFWQF